MKQDLFQKILHVFSRFQVVGFCCLSYAVLGRYSPDMKAIIEELNLAKSTVYSGNVGVGGFNILNVPDELVNSATFLTDWNLPFLQAALERGDKFIFATNIGSNMFVNGKLTGYGKEILFLAYSKISDILIGG